MLEVIEKLQDHLKDGAEIEAVKKAIEDGVRSEIDKQVSAIRSNKNEILSEKRELEEKLKRLDKIDVEEYNTLKEQEMRRQAGEGGKPAELVDMQLALQKLETERDFLKSDLQKHKAQFESIQTAYNKEKIQSALSKEFSGLGVSDEYKSVLVKANALNADVTTDESGNPIVYMNTQSGKLPVTEWAKSWGESQEAKAFIKAQVSSGGGAQGAGGKYAGKSFADMTLSERTELAKSDPGLYKEMKGQ